jgi:cytoskeletal protein RodZ
LRRLRQGKLPALRRWPMSITLALVFAVVGLIGLWALFVH